MNVREAHKGDLARLLELYQEPNALYGEAEEMNREYAEHFFAEVLSDEHQTTLVAEEEGEVVGTLVVAVLPNLAHGGAPYAVVENVVVDPERRGEGIGEDLMQAAMERARGTGAYKLALTANLQRERAHGFYRRLGFRETHLGFEMSL